MNTVKTQAKPVALVTGAARRIGAAIIKELHNKGFIVAIHCNQSQIDADNLANKLNEKSAASAQVFCADLTDKGQACEIIDSIIKWQGRLDLLVNNASIFIKDENVTDANWHKLFTTNVQAPFWLSTSAYPYLAKQNGVIINITDTHADKPLKDYGVYCQTKAALNMQTKSHALEFAPEVRVNAIAPGAIAWPEQGNELTDNKKKKIIAQTPLKKEGAPCVIAQAVLALASNDFITGQILRVDGGRVL